MFGGGGVGTRLNSPGQPEHPRETTARLELCSSSRALLFASSTRLAPSSPSSAAKSAATEYDCPHRDSPVARRRLRTCPRHTPPSFEKLTQLRLRLRQTLHRGVAEPLGRPGVVSPFQLDQPQQILTALACGFLQP
jgi:hypothetical protein